MSRPPLARERVLDAYEALLIAEGERGATMDAIARQAGVSKGGLLYHFASKEALEAALLARTEALAEEDVALIRSDAAGPVAAFMRSSVLNDSPVDRALIAATKLAQSGNAEAAHALRRVRQQWEDVLRPHTRDETALQLVMLVSDGLYFNNAIDDAIVQGPVPQGAEMDALIALVESATRD